MPLGPLRPRSLHRDRWRRPPQLTPEKARASGDFTRRGACVVVSLAPPLAGSVRGMHVRLPLDDRFRDGLRENRGLTDNL
jgi:hypothetical protein